MPRSTVFVQTLGLPGPALRFVEANAVRHGYFTTVQSLIPRLFSEIPCTLTNTAWTPSLLATLTHTERTNIANCWGIKATSDSETDPAEFDIAVTDCALILDAIFTFSPPGTITQLVPDVSRLRLDFWNALYGGAVPTYQHALNVLRGTTVLPKGARAALRKKGPLPIEDVALLQKAVLVSRDTLGEFEAIAAGDRTEIPGDTLRKISRSIADKNCNRGHAYRLLEEFLVPTIRIRNYLDHLVFRMSWLGVLRCLRAAQRTAPGALCVNKTALAAAPRNS